MVISTRYQAGMECSLHQAWQPPIPSLGLPVSLVFIHSFRCWAFCENVVIVKHYVQSAMWEWEPYV